MNEETISVIEVARELGTNKQRIFKVLKRLGIDSKKLKSSDHHGQKVAFVTIDEYDRVKSYLAESTRDSGEPPLHNDVGGVFYVVQLEPEHDPGRFKIGFASNIDDRLRQHRTSAPYSTVLKTWPCKLLWEKTAIDCVSQGCERVRTEVFRTEAIDTVLERCEAFFSLMPLIEMGG